MKQHLQHTIRTATTFAHELVDPLEPEQMHVMPAVNGGVPLNPPAWIVGHLVVTLGDLAKRLGQSVALPVGWQERFGNSSIPATGAEDYPPKDELLRRLDDVATAIDRGLDDLPEERLAEPMPEQFRKMVPTLGDEVAFTGILHAAIHIGQLTSWRRCMGIGPRF